ncbi:MAG TPA: hypothetical protein VIF62_29855 [Labilithrix sp.]
MSLILAGIIASATSGAIVIGRWIARRRAAAARPETKDEKKNDDGETKKKDNSRDDGKEPEKRMTTKRDDAPEVLEGFPCQLGDVLMRMTGEEAWLAGGLVLAEEVPVAALWVAPEAGHDVAIYARPKPRDVVYWLAPLDPGAVLVAGEPPTSVEHGGVRFDRVRRLPLRPKRVGVGAPDVGDAVIVAEYASAGSDRILVVKSTTGQPARAWRGVELEPSSFEVIASGRKTLDD